MNFSITTPDSTRMPVSTGGGSTAGIGVAPGNNVVEDRPPVLYANPSVYPSQIGVSETNPAKKSSVAGLIIGGFVLYWLFSKG